MEDSNGEFEIVDQKMANLNYMPEISKTDSNRQSLLTNVPPPSELPSFVTSPLMPQLSSISTNKNQATAEPKGSNISLATTNIPLSVPTTVTGINVVASAPKIGTSWQSNAPSSNSGVSSSSLPVTSQPLSPISASSISEVASNENASEENASGNWMGWIKGTVQSVGSKVAEKAKSSMDTMITTLDPQMKELIIGQSCITDSGGDIDIIVASDKEVKVNPVREAFQKVFGKATVNGFASQSSSAALQVTGFEAALKSAAERIDNVRSSGKIHPQQPVVAVEGFIVEFGPETWVELSLLLLDDPWHDVVLQTYSQPTPVPIEYIKQAQEGTPADYPLRESGLSVSIGYTAAQQLNVEPSMWQEALTEVSRRETILLAAKSLAGMYRLRLPKDVI